MDSTDNEVVEFILEKEKLMNKFDIKIQIKFIKSKFTYQILFQTKWNDFKVCIFDFF